MYYIILIRTLTAKKQHNGLHDFMVHSPWFSGWKWAWLGEGPAFLKSSLPLSAPHPPSPFIIDRFDDRRYSLVFNLFHWASWRQSLWDLKQQSPPLFSISPPPPLPTTSHHSHIWSFTMWKWFESMVSNIGSLELPYGVINMRVNPITMQGRRSNTMLRKVIQLTSFILSSPCIGEGRGLPLK